MLLLCFISLIFCIFLVSSAKHLSLPEGYAGNNEGRKPSKTGGLDYSKFDQIEDSDDEAQSSSARERERESVFSCFGSLSNDRYP